MYSHAATRSEQNDHPYGPLNEIRSCVFGIRRFGLIGYTYGVTLARKGARRDGGCRISRKCL